MKITHEEIDLLSSLQQHPGWKVYESIVFAKIEQLSEMIDSLSTKSKDVTYNNTEVTILTKSFLREVLELPAVVTEWFRLDQNIIKVNAEIQKYIEDLDN